MRPRLLPSKFRNTRLPSSAVNSLRNTELFHLTSFISHCSALFSATGATQPFWNQFVPHSFYRHGGVRGSIPQPQSIHPPISILQHPQFSTGYLPPAGLLRRKRLAYAAEQSSRGKIPCGKLRMLEDGEIGRAHV